MNPAKGRVAELVQRVLDNDPANAAIVIVALQAAEADDTLRSYATLSAMLAQAGNTEATFTNYARVVYTDADAVTRVVDNVNDRVDCDFPDFTYTAAGGTVDNSLVKQIPCFDPDTTGGTDADLIPLTHHDFVQATNGGDITGQVDAAGFFRAT